MTNDIYAAQAATVFEIADGNRTVLQAVRGNGAEAASAEAGKMLLNLYPTAEQSGLLNTETKRLEMAGGEFCGNASAAAAVLLSNILAESTVRYDVSGFDGNVTADVVSLSDGQYRVRTSFDGMNYAVGKHTYKDRPLKIIDMKGIVHVLIEGAFPASNYESVHHELTTSLGLDEREAVGVIWYTQQEQGVNMYPVVWVRKVDTLYYESACGSGAIAAALCTGRHDIIQPTGRTITVRIDEDKVMTECMVAVVAQ